MGPEDRTISIPDRPSVAVMYGGRISASIIVFEWIHRKIGSLERGGLLLELKKRSFQPCKGFGVLREMAALI